MFEFWLIDWFKEEYPLADETDDGFKNAAWFVMNTIADTWCAGMTYREWANAARFKLGLFLDEDEMKRNAA